LAESAYKNGHLKAAWRHLERAHILGQAWPIQHTQAHLCMLSFAFRVKNVPDQATWHISQPS